MGGRAGAWALILVLMLFAWPLAAQSPQPRPAPDPTPAIDRLERTIRSELERIEGAIREAAPREDRAAERRKEARETADLKAQQDMARWAEAMTWATCAAVVVSFISVLGLFFTYREAREGNKLALQHNKVQSFAYLTFVSGTLLFNTEQDRRPWVGFKVKNTGLTQAEVFAYVVNLSITADGGPPRALVMEPPIDDLGFTDIPSNAEVYKRATSEIDALTDDEWQCLVTPGRGLRVSITIDFTFKTLGETKGRRIVLSGPVTYIRGEYIFKIPRTSDTASPPPELP